MIPAHRVNEAYDTLNLARDATIQSVRDRAKLLRDRFNTAADGDKLSKVEAAFALLEQADTISKAQREAISASTRSRSERELDGRLIKMTADSATAAGSKRVAPISETEVKRMKSDETKPELKQEPPTEDVDQATLDRQSNAKVFEKLNLLMRDEAKYLRAVNVLFNVVNALIEKASYDPETVRMLSDSVDIACTTKSTSDRAVPLANHNEDNRKAVTRVVNLVLAHDQLTSHIETANSGITRMWSHAVIFRNSLFELDNFNYLRKCRELASLISGLKLPVDSETDERFMNELLISVEIMCSKAVCRIIPGRLNDTKTTMTEIYKLSRNANFPSQFSERIAELQRQVMSS